MELVPDPMIAYRDGKAHGEAGKEPVSAGYKYVNAYMGGWRDGRNIYVLNQRRAELQEKGR